MTTDFSVTDNLRDNFISVVLTVLIVLAVILWFINIRCKLLRRRRVSLKGKVVLITGSGSGLGKALCLTFARENCDVICVDVDEKGNEDTVNKIKQISRLCKVRSFPVDVSNFEEIQKLNQRILKEFPSGIDILVNNAGISHVALIIDQKTSDIERLINVNLISHFWTIKTFLPNMLKKNSGTVVAIASVCGYLPTEGAIPYAASKFGVVGLMDSLSLELRTLKSKLRTLTVCPSYVGTNILPEELSKPGITWINNIPFHILDASKVSEGIINAIKDGKRVYITPCYMRIFIFLVQTLMPRCISDRIIGTFLIMTKIRDDIQNIRLTESLK